MFFIQIGLGRNHLVAAAAAKLKLFQVSFRFIRSQRSEISLQNEINSEEASIFSNKKYKDLMKIALEEQNDLLESAKNQYSLELLNKSLQELSLNRISYFILKDKKVNYIS